MTRARINYVEGTERTTFIYRRPGSRFAPRVWAWSLTGGLAVGVGAALALAVAGLTGTGGRSFDGAVIAGTVVGALALYAGTYRAAQRAMGLRISFDYVDNAVGIRLIDGPAWRWFPVEDVLDFRLARQTTGWRAGCTLIMDTDSAGPVELVMARRDCYEESGLPHLVSRLNARLQTVAGITSSELPPPPPPAHVRPPSPAHRDYPDSDFDSGPVPDVTPPGRRKLPDPRDVQH